MNNMERARQVFEAHCHADRDTIINQMVKAGIKATTASTYYVGLKKTMPVRQTAGIPPVVEETDDEIKARIVERFAAMELMAESTLLGMNRSLIISGPPGLGKSYGVTAKAREVQSVGGKTVVQISGDVSGAGLYRSLYENRGENCTTIFDDADSVFDSEVTLNLLKAACDSTEQRNICWMKEIRMEDDDGTRLPTSFPFDGSVIFITNKDFPAMISRQTKMSPHLAALVSRSMYLDLLLKTPRDYLVRIKHVVFDEEMYRLHNLKVREAEQIVDFIEENLTKFREYDLSLRLVIKIANWFKADQSNWKRLSAITFFKS